VWCDAVWCFGSRCGARCGVRFACWDIIGRGAFRPRAMGFHQRKRGVIPVVGGGGSGRGPWMGLNQVILDRSPEDGVRRGPRAQERRAEGPVGNRWVTVGRHRLCGWSDERKPARWMRRRCCGAVVRRYGSASGQGRAVASPHNRTSAGKTRPCPSAQSVPKSKPNPNPADRSVHIYQRCVRARSRRHRWEPVQMLWHGGTPDRQLQVSRGARRGRGEARRGEARRGEADLTGSREPLDRVWG
jgi:hypothetical protein